MREDEKRSIWTGLVALLVVGLVVGTIAGAAAFLGVRGLGLDGPSAAQGGGSDGPGASLEAPTPSETEPPEGPLITLPGGTEEPEEPEESPTEEESESEEPESEIALQAGQAQVGAGQQIDLTGVYPGGEGANLTVQRRLDGQWVQFGQSPVTMTVSGETFSTFVITSQSGDNEFRVIDDEGEASNPVTVTVS